MVYKRENVAGDLVFGIKATDDELYMKQAAAFSKFRRLALTYMPGDVLDAAFDQIKKTLAGQSPEAAMERLVRGFDAIKVTIAQLQEYLGHSVSQISPEEIANLRGVYTTVKTEEMSWAEVMATKQHTGSAAEAEKVGREKLDNLKKETPSEPESKAPPKHVEDLIRLQVSTPKELYWSVLGTNGVEKPELATVAQYEAIVKELAEVMPKPSAPDPSPEPPKPVSETVKRDAPKFGQKGGK